MSTSLEDSLVLIQFQKANEEFFKALSLLLMILADVEFEFVTKSLHIFAFDLHFNLDFSQVIMLNR